MKKITSLLLVLVLGILAFTSCAISHKDDDDDEYKMSDFKKNLEKAGYETDDIDDKEDIERMFEMIDLNYDDYKVKAMLNAFNAGESVTIVQCSSASNAKKFANDIKVFYDDEQITMIEIKVEGAFALVGSAPAINAALSSSSKEENKKPSSLTVSDYETNLRNAGYEISRFSESETDALFSVLHLNQKNYNLKTMFSANKHTTGDSGVSVFECGSATYAKKLKTDLLNAYEDLYGSIVTDSIKIEIYGSIVLVGADSAINAAKGNS